MNGLLGRLYGVDGCPHCEAAAAFFMGAQVPVQLVSTTDDPIAQEGLKKILEKEQVEVPVLVSFVTKEIIRGADFGNYQRVVEAYRASLQSGTTNIPAGQVGNPGEAPPVPIEVEVSEAASGVSEVSGSVDSLGSSDPSLVN